MTAYDGPSRRSRVRIIGATEEQWRSEFPKAERFWLNEYVGQECDAIVYPELGSAQLDGSQLTPPVAKWQSVSVKYMEEL